MRRSKSSRAVREAAAPVQPSGPTVADLLALLAAQQIARVQEDERARRAYIERVAESVNHTADTMRTLQTSDLGKKAGHSATQYERLVLGQLQTKVHRALVRGFADHHAGRDAEAQKSFDEYARHMADVAWIWDVMTERVRTGVDNRHITDHWLLPGAIETRVAEVDAQGKPSRLLRLMG
jgi:hypothetical protein